MAGRCIKILHSYTGYYGLHVILGNTLAVLLYVSSAINDNKLGGSYQQTCNYVIVIFAQMSLSIAKARDLWHVAFT